MAERVDLTMSAPGRRGIAGFFLMRGEELRASAGEYLVTRSGGECQDLGLTSLMRRGREAGAGQCWPPC